MCEEEPRWRNWIYLGCNRRFIVQPTSYTIFVSWFVEIRIASSSWLHGSWWTPPSCPLTSGLPCLVALYPQTVSQTNPSSFMLLLLRQTVKRWRKWLLLVVFCCPAPVHLEMPGLFFRKKLFLLQCHVVGTADEHGLMRVSLGGSGRTWLVDSGSVILSTHLCR